MDFNIVTLEVADLLIHFDYYDQLITGGPDEQAKIRNKRSEHLADLFPGAVFYDAKQKLHPLTKLKGPIIARLSQMKNKDIHELIEKLEKDTKKMKKLYKAQAKS